jgi:hypothetical protein
MHFMPLAHQLARDVRADKTDSTGDEDFHSREPYWAV